MALARQAATPIRGTLKRDGAAIDLAWAWVVDGTVRAGARVEHDGTTYTVTGLGARYKRQRDWYVYAYVQRSEPTAASANACTRCRRDSAELLTSARGPLCPRCYDETGDE